MNYSTIIFDFDGTLFDTRNAIAATINKTFQDKLGLAISEERIWGTIQKGITLEETFDSLLPKEKRMEVADWVTRYREIYNSGLGLKMSKPFGNLKSLFSSPLLNGVSLVLVTNKGRVAVEQILQKDNIEQVFDIIVAADGSSPTKPDPKSYYDRIKPNLPDGADEHVMVFGDTMADIEYADKIGADSCWASYGYGDVKKCSSKKPKYVVHNLSEFLETISSPSANGSKNSHILVDIDNGVKKNSVYETIKSEFETFCVSDVSRISARNAISSVTKNALELFKDHINNPDALVPVARAGMAMWEMVDNEFDAPATSFAIAKKVKGTKSVTVTFSTGLSGNLQRLMILDTVSATGDTIVKVGKELQEAYPQATLDVFLCYASPEAMESIEQSGYFDTVLVAVRSTTVDAAGWLIPKINGDAGDKLYGTVAR